MSLRAQTTAAQARAQFMRKQRDETTLRALRLDGDVEIPIVALGHNVVGQISTQGLSRELRLNVYVPSDSFSVATRRRNVAECESPASIRERILCSVARTRGSEESSVVIAEASIDIVTIVRP